jgi:hypothetical protein
MNQETGSTSGPKKTNDYDEEDHDELVLEEEIEFLDV